LKIFIHLLHGVFVSRRFLVWRAAASINDAAAGRCGPASVEAVQHQHRGTLLGGLQCGACARSTKADYDYVYFSIPPLIFPLCGHLILLWKGEPYIRTRKGRAGLYLTQGVLSTIA